MNNEYGALVVERNLFHCYFVHYKSNMTGLGNEPGPPHHSEMTIYFAYN